MSLGVVGRKCGMTRIFTDNGDSTPVTVIHVEPNIVTQIKNIKKDGYCAVQVTTGIKKRSRLNKAETGHFAKAVVEPGRGLWEFRVEQNCLEDFQISKSVDVSLFKVGQKVDVTATSKGKGFQGVVKRHNFKTQYATHGNSLSHRAHGSTGQNQTPGRVFKNKKMAGQMGNVKKTIQTLEVIRIDPDNGILLLKGGIPGSKGGNVIITSAVKVNA
jgi:large subunit ribosomal protein L3